MVRRVGSWLTMVFALSGCGPAGTQEPETSFIAMPKDFQGYESWEGFVLPPGNAADPHTAIGRTVHLNRRPPQGSTEFPIGTILVKVPADANSSGDVFAMVKRGGTYNFQGAVGWEWFELFPNGANEPPIIKWRGLGPPSGEEYRSAAGTCNQCHAAAAENDFVMTEPLQLHSF